MRPLRLASLILLIAALSACDPFAPVVTPTAVVIIVTPDATETPIPSPTTPPTATPTATLTPTPTATPAPLPCASDPGQVIRFDDFRSPSSGETLRYRVYIPPCYVEVQRRYPVLYLLPGLRQDETQWGTLGIAAVLDQGIRQGAIAPMIVVMPALGALGARDAFPPGTSYEGYILDELRPAIERDFCTIQQRDQRAIGGISRGGFWAYSIALRHPTVFGIVGGHAAAFDPANAPAASNPLELALDAPFLQNANLRMYLDNGSNDPAGTNLGVFSGRLSARGIAHTYVITPGAGHDDPYWASQLDEYLLFYSQGWTRDVNSLPSCLEPSP
jgi:enterochelin esterase-like enzyme